MFAWVHLALARPTDGGQFSFDAADVVTSLDGPTQTVRVWYSTAGPNAVILNDEDENGLPDFAELVAAEAESVLTAYADVGFRSPVGDGVRGGSPAMDAYLVDFAGMSDGQFAAESCDGDICAGYFVMENDFQGYGYSDLAEAVRVLTSHELFHAVQAAYDASAPVWFSEGTAVWAERFYDPDSEDFLSFCDAYLQDTGRSLDEPPAGPVPAFAYATALWWWFLTEAYGYEVMLELLDSTVDDGDILASMAALEAVHSGSLSHDWARFARWNLATGERAGGMESYPFAEDLRAIRIREDGPNLADDNRFYPLAATYYSIDHGGGALGFGIEEDAPNLTFSVHPADDGGHALEALATFSGTPTDLGDQPPGTYWLVGSNPTLDTQSTKRMICFGADVSACAPVEQAELAGDGDLEPSCGCGATPAPERNGSALIGAVLALAAARRRR